MELTQSNGGAYIFTQQPYGGVDAYNQPGFQGGLVFRSSLPQPTREDVVTWCCHCHHTRKAAVKCIAAMYRNLSA